MFSTKSLFFNINQCVGGNLMECIQECHYVWLQHN